MSDAQNSQSVVDNLAQNLSFLVRSSVNSMNIRKTVSCNALFHNKKIMSTNDVYVIPEEHVNGDLIN